MGVVVKFHARASSRADRSAKTSKVISRRLPLDTAKATSIGQRRGGMPLVRHPLTMLLFSLSSLDTAMVPPSASMIDPELRSRMAVYIVRQWRTCQEFASRMSLDRQESAVISLMRDFFRDQTRRLRAVRIACGYPKQVAWAKELGVTKGTWSDIENGKKPISLEMARLIKVRWHLPLDFLLDGDTDAIEQAPAKIVRKLQELAA